MPSSAKGSTRIYLSGMTCLNCGEAQYPDGYAKEGRKTTTLPCPACGHAAKATMLWRDLRKRIAARDARDASPR